MNKKDREALDKFVDEDSLSPEDTKRFAEMSDGERFFEAGAKHGRAELKEENKKLRSLIKDLANTGMDFDIATRIEELEVGEE